MTDLLSIAESVARSAAGLAFERRTEGVEITMTKSTVTDVVTAADADVEQLVLRRIRQLRPDDGILGEEGTSVDGTTGITWVVDPIDGTVNYLYGLDGYAVSIAAVEGPTRVEELRAESWTGLAAAIVAPASGAVYTAAAGKGASLNGQSIRASAADSMASALVATGFGYDPGRRSRQGAAVAQLLPKVRDIRRLGAAALDLAMCGAGRLDAYFEKGIRPWDVAAGLLIAAEAGCVTHIEDAGGELFAAVAAPGIAEELFASLEHIGAAKA